MSNTPKGYKQTEVGVIPEDWQIERVGDLLEIFGRIGFRGYTKADIVDKENGAITLSPSNIINGKIDYSNCTYISWRKYYESPEIQLCENDVVFVKTGSTVGKTCLMKDLPREATLNPQIVVFKGIKADNVLLSYMVADRRFQSQIKAIVVGGAIPTLSQKQISNLEVIIPKSMFEQNLIANVLSDTDSLITSLEKLIAKKKLVKKGAMQDLLTGKKRLPEFDNGQGYKQTEVGQVPGDWEVLNVNDICVAEKGKGLSKSKVDSQGRYECILYGELFTTYTEIISGIKSRTNYCEGNFSKSGDVLLPGSTTTTGIDLAKASAILKDDVLLGGDIIILRGKTQRFDPIFLAFILTYVYPKQIGNITQGITIHHLYGSNLKNISIALPQIKEQTSIANVLSEMDSEIDILEKKLEKYKKIKEGMMQKLLTGQIRLI